MELYLDFIINLTYKIHKTHLGFDCLNEDEDIFNHFKWCYNSICEQFLEQEIDFRNNDELINILYKLFYENLYTKSKLYPLSKYLMSWNEIFTNKKPKNVAIVYNIYENFDETVVNS
jgi:hypothetical protein